jgi:hypothetical protein
MLATVPRILERTVDRPLGGPSTWDAHPVHHRSMLQEFVDAERAGRKGGHLPATLEVSSFLNPETI